MLLTSGMRLGPYEILGPLGAGGMGEVYRAHDPRLEREVAIKIVRGEKAASEAWRERFEREARTIAALSHPNILAIHDVGGDDGRFYAVMELLAGETLRARIERGPLPWRKATEIASAIADGLGAAHAKGVVHRDLKPANVFLTADGQVKVLDFGLATLGETVGANSLSSPTLAETSPGSLPGTVGYFSPEQVAGMAASARSDLFALGCVLHEMLSGGRTFARRTPAETMAAILTDDAPEFVNGVPLALRRLIARCLEKDPEARFQSARDLAFHLRALLGSDVSVGGAKRAAPWQTTRRAVASFVAGGASVAVAAIGMVLWSPWQPAPVAVQSYVLPPYGTVLSGRSIGVSFLAGSFAISPDGQQLVFAASEPSGKPWLWVRRLDSLTTRKLEGTEDASGPFWSQDSRSIGFNSGGLLKKIAVSGGPPQTLTETKVPDFWFPGGDWSASGDILFGQYFLPLLRIPASGGPAIPATDMNRSRGETHHCCPAFLPDGRHFLYFVSATSPERTGIYLGVLDSTVSTFLVRSTGKAVFASPGHLLFRRGDVLMAAPFDATRVRVTGEPTALTDRGGAFSVSATGVLVYAPVVGSRQLVWIDRNGHEIEQLPIRGNLRNRRLSHDGRHLAAAVPDLQTGNTDIWVYDLVRHVSTRVTSHPADEHSPVWSSDDQRIVFASNRRGRFDVYEKAADGTGDEQLIYASAASKGVGSWSGDSRHLVFNTDGEAEGQLWTLSLPDAKPTLLFRASALVWDGQISPDGRFVAYMSSETGRHEVYVQRYPAGPKWRLSGSGGRWPKWRPDGKELFFFDDGARMVMAVDVPAAGGFDARPPRALFSVAAAYTDGWFNTPDGERFLFAKNIPEESVDALTLVQNWPALLRQ